jgi:uncharacterized protein (TIGR03437 family)
MLESRNRLRAYDAANLNTELWDSDQNFARDGLGQFVKWSAPAVANGKVYAGTQNSLAVYGLLGGSTAAVTAKNAASGQANTAAPGSIISIFGSMLAQSTADAGKYPLPPVLAGASVTINAQPAPLFYASSSQLNVQVPFETAIGAAAVTVSAGGVAAGSFTLMVQNAAPGLFASSIPGHAAVVNSDGNVNSPSQPAARGSYVAAYLTGLGPVDPPVATGVAASANPISYLIGMATATVGGQSAQVTFAGLAPGYAGLYQVNILLPQLAPGDYPLQISAGGQMSNTQLISVR